MACSAPSAVIVSRNYPLLYESGLDCVWNIHTSVGTYVEVIFTDFNVSSTTPLCNEDYLEFISGDTNIRLCNANIEEHEGRFKSNQNDLTIRFRTNFDGDSGRFYATYEELSFSAGNDSDGKSFAFALPFCAVNFIHTDLCIDLKKKHQYLQITV